MRITIDDHDFYSPDEFVIREIELRPENARVSLRAGTAFESGWEYKVIAAEDFGEYSQDGNPEKFQYEAAWELRDATILVKEYNPARSGLAR